MDNRVAWLRELLKVDAVELVFLPPSDWSTLPTDSTLLRREAISGNVDFVKVLLGTLAVDTPPREINIIVHDLVKSGLDVGLAAKAAEKIDMKKKIWNREIDGEGTRRYQREGPLNVGGAAVHRFHAELTGGDHHVFPMSAPASVFLEFGEDNSEVIGVRLLERLGDL